MTSFSSPYLVGFLVSGGLGLMAFFASGEPVNAFSQGILTSAVLLISETYSLGESVSGFSGDIFAPLPASFAHCAL